MASPANQQLNAKNTIRAASISTDEPCWITAEVNAIEVIRQVSQPLLGASPLSVDQIKQGGSTSSKLWAEIAYHKEGIGRRVAFDINAGMRVSVHACSAQINIITPPVCASVRGSTSSARPSTAEDTFIPGDGLYLDTLLRTSLMPGLAPVRGEAQLTQTFIPDPGDTIFVPCPPGAVGVEIYALGPVFPIAGTWLEQGSVLGTIPPGGAIATIPFLTIAAARTGTVPQPGNAIGISTTNTNVGAIPITYVWNLEF